MFGEAWEQECVSLGFEPQFVAHRADGMHIRTLPPLSPTPFVYALPLLLSPQAPAAASIASSEGSPQSCCSCAFIILISSTLCHRVFVQNFRV